MWECPECGKKLKAPGTHPRSHKVEMEPVDIDATIQEDEGKLIASIVVEDICQCPDDDVSRDCKEHGHLMTCVYCHSGFGEIYTDNRPTSVMLKCINCSRVYAVNVQAKIIAWHG